MNTEESEIYEFLKRFSNQFVSVADISRGAANQNDVYQDRNWVQAILRRMLMEGWIEANPEGEYRLKHQPEETTSFRQALETPGAPLGDTTIVAVGEKSENHADAAR